MKNCVLTLLIAATLSGCVQTTGERSGLEGIELAIQDNPQQARSALADIDRGSLRTPREKALFCLLSSMAEDKCYNDLTSDTLISPAVAYYSRHGDNYHKFLAYYYQGRVYENAEDYAPAMSAFLNAEDYAESAPDEYKVRLHAAKERVYLHQFAQDRALDEVFKAKEISKNIDNPAYFLHNCYDAITQLTIQGEAERARKELEELDAWMTERNLARDAEFYRISLRRDLSVPVKDTAKIKELSGNYLSRCEAEGIPANPVLMADACIELGDFAAAANYMQGHEDEPGSTLFDTAGKYETLSRIQEGLGRYKEALQYRDKYRETTDIINMTVFNNDIRFLEERYKRELEKEKLTHTRTLLSIVVILLSGGLVWGIVAYSRRRREYDVALKDARAEYAFLKDIHDKAAGENGELTDLIAKRIQALRPYISGRRMNMIMARQDMDSINKDRKEMLTSVFLFYAITYPDFVKVLADAGMTSEEIGLCVLYLLGYSHKEMNDFLYSQGIRQINVSIRKKLNLAPNGVKLKTKLNDLFDKYYPKKG